MASVSIHPPKTPVTKGSMSIAKATLPVQMFGLANVGALHGNFSAPSLVTRALAPFGFAMVMTAVGTQAAVAGTAAVGLASLAAYVVATRANSKQRVAACEA